MDAEQTQKKETIVKSMKKNFKDFRQRYGKDAKSVMYATATKLAMKEAVVKEIDPHNAAAGMKEDDGPHFTKLKDSDTPNFTTVAHPEDVVNQPKSDGNVDPYDKRGKREVGKRGMKKKETDGYGPEEFTGAVARIAKESVELQEIAVPTKKRTALKIAMRALALKEAHLHELSKKTLRSYVSKAAYDMHDTGKKAAFASMKAVTEKKPQSDKYAKRVLKRSKGISDATRKLAEGSDRAGYTKRGNNAKDRDTHTAAQTSSEKIRNVKTSPDTDARSYGRFHSDKYNSGPASSSSDRAGKRKDLQSKSSAAPTPTAASNHRMMDILNHPHYKKIAKKD